MFFVVLVNNMSAMNSRATPYVKLHQYKQMSEVVAGLANEETNNFSAVVSSFFQIFYFELDRHLWPCQKYLSLESVSERYIIYLFT